MSKKQISLLKDMKVAQVLTALIMAGTGTFLLLNHFFIVPLFYIAVTVSGIAYTAKYIAAKDRRNGWDLITGIVSFTLGVFMLTSSPATKAFGFVSIEYLTAIWIMFAGIMSIGGCFGKEKGKGWKIAGGILAIIAGVLFMMFPMLGSIIVTNVMGIYAGIAMIIIALMILASALSGKNAHQLLLPEGSAAQ